MEYDLYNLCYQSGCRCSPDWSVELDNLYIESFNSRECYPDDIACTTLARTVLPYSGMNVLQVAIKTNNKTLLKRIISNNYILDNININHRDRDGLTYRDYLLKYKRHEMIGILSGVKLKHENSNIIKIK